MQHKIKQGILWIHSASLCRRSLPESGKFDSIWRRKRRNERSPQNNGFGPILCLSNWLAEGLCGRSSQQNWIHFQTSSVHSFNDGLSGSWRLFTRSSTSVDVSSLPNGISSVNIYQNPQHRLSITIHASLWNSVKLTSMLNIPNAQISVSFVIFVIGRRSHITSGANHLGFPASCIVKDVSNWSFVAILLSPKSDIIGFPFESMSTFV